LFADTISANAYKPLVDEGDGMALIPNGREVSTETGANRSGSDLDGQPVVVSGSHEEIEDFGWRTVWQAAETKYSRGLFEQIGDTRVIRVTTADCANETA
jgi:hypothetical protein